MLRSIPRYLVHLLALLAMAFCLAITMGAARAQTTLLNVSYDPTRELYRDINREFISDWKARTGQTLTIRQSHGGSGSQARSVIDGLNADIVTLALSADIDAIAERTKKLPDQWQKRLPQNSSPYTSTIIFLVRKGNPKGVRDWDDLVKPGIQVITPNPKTSGGARWNYLAAWAFADKLFNKDETKVRDFVGRLLNNVPILDTGARASTNTFTKRGIGDVLLSWENEAFLALKEAGGDQFEILVPSLSILAEPPVALIDANVDTNKTRSAAQAYLEFLYTPKAQAIIAKNFYRPRDAQHVDPKDLVRFPKIELVNIDDAFGGWSKVQQAHFADGGIFDQIYKPGR